MKKFSKLNESKQTVDNSTNRNDFISNLIKETLSVKYDKIIGKDVLAKTLNKILDINESKITIKVLENIKAASFHTFNLNWINESIEEEKRKMKNGEECEECEECEDEECEDKKGAAPYKARLEEIVELAEDLYHQFSEEQLPDWVQDKIVKVKQHLLDLQEYMHSEAEYEEGEELGPNRTMEQSREFDEEKAEEKAEEKDEEKENDIIHFDEFEEPEIEEIEEETMFVKESTYNQYNELYNLMKTIGKINEEHHLENKDERINFVLSNLGSKKVEKVVISKISDLPDYVKSADIEKTLRNLSDKEVEELYLEVEDCIGIKESKVELIKEEHHLNTKKDRIDFILANTKNDMVNSYVLNYVKNHPDYLRSGDVEKTLKKLNEDEVEEIYLSIEKIIGVK